jgi:hypothetical protein
LNEIGGRTPFHNYERNGMGTSRMGLVKGSVKSPSISFSLGKSCPPLKGGNNMREENSLDKGVDPCMWVHE